MKTLRPSIFTAGALLAAILSGYGACSTPSPERAAAPSVESSRASSSRPARPDAGSPVPGAQNLDIPGVDASSSSPFRSESPSARRDVGGGAEQTDLRTVEFEADGRRFEGTLTVPPRTRREPGPGVLLLHDSGPLSRHAHMSGQFMTHFGFDLPVFDHLAEELAAAGYVVLRYDKRSCHQETNSHCQGNEYPKPDEEPNVDSFLRDASRALAWLRDHANTDPDQIFAVGHGQGGTLVPHLMDGREWITGGMLVATPHEPLDSLYRTQARLMRTMLEKSGMPEFEIEALEPMERIEHAAAGLTDLRQNNYGDDLLGGRPVAFWKSWLRRSDEAPKLAAELERPLLVVSGTYDYNVPPSELEKWRATLTAGSTDVGHEFLLLDCVTHALNCIDESDPMEVEAEDVARRVDDRVTDALVAFIERNRR